MSNTNYANLTGYNGNIGIQDHNGMLEIIPSQDEFLILTPKQVAELVGICSKWLAERVGESAAVGGSVD